MTFLDLPISHLVKNLPCYVILWLLRHMSRGSLLLVYTDVYMQKSLEQAHQ